MNQRIPTRRSLVRRALSAFGQACDDYKWLPLAIAIVLAIIVNYPWSAQ